MSGGHDPAGTVIAGTHISPRKSTISCRPSEIDDPPSFPGVRSCGECADMWRGIARSLEDRIVA
jgi:hypothetical protein